MSIDNILESSPCFSKDTKYWLVRSGIQSQFFNHFEANEEIALGWDKIRNIDYIKREFSLEVLKNDVFANYDSLFKELLKTKKVNIKRRISDISGKIFRFVNELKIGDIIITPGNDEVLIGQVLSDVFLVDGIYKTEYSSKEEAIVGELNKVRKVKWVKKIRRVDLEPNLKLIINVNHGISCISNEQVITEINRTLYDFYVRDNEGHSIFRIKTQDAIDFEKYALFIKHAYGVYNLLKDESMGEKLTIKTNIQSPGPIEFIGNPSLVGVLSIALFSLFKKRTEALNNLDEVNQNKIKNYMEANQVDDELDDYEFPYDGEF